MGYADFESILVAEDNKNNINVIPNGLEKHMSFTISNKLNFIDTFQFLSFLLYSSVKNLSKDVLSIGVKKNVTITY